MTTEAKIGIQPDLPHNPNTAAPFHKDGTDNGTFSYDISFNPPSGPEGTYPLAKLPEKRSERMPAVEDLVPMRTIGPFEFPPGCLESMGPDGEAIKQDTTCMKDPDIVQYDPETGNMLVVGSWGRSDQQKWINAIYTLNTNGQAGSIAALDLPGLAGKPVAVAPAAEVDPQTGKIQMFTMESCFEPDGNFPLFETNDGQNFEFKGFPLGEVAKEFPAEVRYDIDTAVIDGRSYVMYTEADYDVNSRGLTQLRNGRTRLFSADSFDSSEWQNEGIILNEDDLGPYHTPNEEWIPEAVSLAQLRSADDQNKGLILMAAVCFNGTEPGRRQKILLRAAHDVQGPYVNLGELHNDENRQPWNEGEYGHPSMVVDHTNGKLLMLEQGRPGPDKVGFNDGGWKVGLTEMPLDEITKLADYRIHMEQAQLKDYPTTVWPTSSSQPQAA